MSFDKAIQKTNNEALYKVRAAKLRYSEAARKRAKLAAACDYPGAPDHLLVMMMKANKEFGIESKIHYEAVREYMRTLRESGQFKEPDFSADEYIAMQEQTNMKEIEDAVKNQQILDSMPSERIDEGVKLMSMDTETRNRFIASGKTFEEFLASESVSMKERVKAGRDLKDPSLGDFDPI